MKATFRVDASVQMGSGHLMRCLTLAEELTERGAQVRFVCRGHVGNLAELLRQKGMPVSVLPVSNGQAASNSDYAAWLGATQAEDAEQTIAALAGEKPDWVVVDHYALDIEWEQRVRSHAGRIFVIDDLAGRHHECEMLLDQNFFPNAEARYSGLVRPACRLLLGPRYALVRKEFRIMRDGLPPRPNKLRNILVFITGGDDQGETLKAMQGVDLFGQAEGVDVVVGKENPHNTQIRDTCAALRWRYHCQVDYMPRLIAEADLAIGAGGSSNWERCALGVPAVVVILAENQAPIARALGEAGIVYNLGWCSDVQVTDYARALSAMNGDRLTAMTEKCLALVDARGAARVADALSEASLNANGRVRHVS